MHFFDEEEDSAESICNAQLSKEERAEKCTYTQDIPLKFKIEFPPENQTRNPAKWSNFPASQSYQAESKTFKKQNITNEENKNKSHKSDCRSSKNKGSHRTTRQNSSILDFREKIDDITNECIEKSMTETRKIRSLFDMGKIGQDVYKMRIDNLSNQQKEYEQSVTDLKLKFTFKFAESDDYMMQSYMKNIKKESEIFKFFSPAYGLKSQVFNKVDNYQVTIINADSAYFFNIVLPLLLYNKYLNHSVIACESNEILVRVLKNRIDAFFSKERAEDEKLFKRSLRVLSETRLLKEFSDSGLSEISSCIICSIPLKRSVIIDILLANLRDLLSSQKESKLILLLSKYDNSAKYQRYFSGKVTTVSLNVPNFVYPVKTIWKTAFSDADEDFVDDVVKTIISIHAIQKSGDIVVYLPVDSDVQSVCSKLDLKMLNYQYDDLLVICINDECFVEQFIQGIVPSKRKVYLITSGYEGLISPSIKYVVDCGILKEYSFDSESDADTLVPSFISRSRAKIRKDVAGIFNVGICFRIYCKKTYEEMHSKEYAEIFFINPIYSLVKVLNHQPLTTEGIQFIESLPETVQVRTLELLKDYGAIDSNLRLTDLGENMVKLPFPTKYSRFILLSFQWGLAYEAVILVAFLSVKSVIFMEAEGTDHQKSIDAVKLDFNVLDSDTISYLNIFRRWKENNFTKLWCSNHFLNHAVLRSIRSKVNELCHIIYDCLGEIVNEKFAEYNDYNNLIELLCVCFPKNLCVFSGHPRIGYKILASQKLALVHTSSFLLSRGEYPQFVLYDELVENETSNFHTLIRTLTCIPFELIMKCLQDATIVYNDSELFDETLSKKVIQPVGEKVISQYLLKNEGRRVRELEESIKKEIGAKVVLIDPILEKGSVYVYSFKNDISKCVSVLDKMLKDHAKTLVNEEEKKIIEFKKGQNSIGIEVKWVKGAQIASFRHGVQATLNQTTPSTFEPTSESVHSTAINYVLLLSWPRRVCSGEGFMNFSSRSDFEIARRLGCRCFPVADTEVYVQVSRIADNQLHISQISCDITKDDIVRCFTKFLSKIKFEVELCYSQPFKTSHEELSNMKKQIEENCKKFTNLQKFEVVISVPKPSAHLMDAHINVFEERSLDVEAKNLSMTKVNDMKISCKPFYFSNIKCNSEIFRALKYRLQNELQKFETELVSKHDGTFLKIVPVKDAGEDNTIELSSNDNEVIKELKMLINGLLDGWKLDKNNLESIHKLFCHGGHRFLETLGKAENVFILENFETKTIRLYGLQDNCNYVRQNISDFLKNTANEVAKTIVLSNDRHNRVILKEIIQKYGVNLEKFIELHKLRSAALDIKTSSVMLYGERDNVFEAEEQLKEISTNIDASNTPEDISSEETCALCTCPAEGLPFRLELCGHLYCSDCIRNLVKQANLPLQCSEKDCSKDIILGDIRYVLENDEAELKELMDKSLKNYMERNQDKIYHCPSADCSMFILKSEITEGKWRCPLCQNSICIQCNVVFHEGYSCEMYRGSQRDPDYSFKVWQGSNKNSKQCPSCNTAIEKKDGCNHMTCVLCFTHFCWLCDKPTPYKRGDEVYAHINVKHPNQLFA